MSKRRLRLSRIKFACFLFSIVSMSHQSFAQSELFANVYGVATHQRNDGIDNDSIRYINNSNGSLSLRYCIGWNQIGKSFEYGGAFGYFRNGTSSGNESQYNNAARNIRMANSKTHYYLFRLFIGKRYSVGKFDLIGQLHFPVQLTYSTDAVQTEESFDANGNLISGIKYYTITPGPYTSVGLEPTLLVTYPIFRNVYFGLNYGYGIIYSFQKSVVKTEMERYGAYGIIEPRRLLRETFSDYSQINSGGSLGFTIRYRLGTTKKDNK